MHIRGNKARMGMGLAVGDGHAAGGDHFAGIGEVFAEIRVFLVLAQACLLRSQVGAARRRGFCPLDDRCLATR